MAEETFSIGIEEEYLLIDPGTRAHAARPPSGFMEACRKSLGGRITHEFPQSRRAQRFGVEAELCDWGRRELKPFAQPTDELIGILRPFAEERGCLREVERAADIARRGSSADHQLRVHDEAPEGGADEHAAKLAVVDWLAEHTVGAVAMEPA